MKKRRKTQRHKHRQVQPINYEKKLLSEIGFLHARVEDKICKANMQRKMRTKIEMQDAHDLIHRVLYRDHEQHFHIIDVTAAEMVIAWVDEALSMTSEDGAYDDYIAIGNEVTKARLYEYFEVPA